MVPAVDDSKEGQAQKTHPPVHTRLPAAGHRFTEAEPLKFNGSNGRKPQTEARRYVYGVLCAMLAHELTDPEGWMFGGIEREPDDRRLRKAIRVVAKEMRRKADKP